MLQSSYFAIAVVIVGVLIAAAAFLANVTVVGGITVRNPDSLVALVTSAEASPTVADGRYDTLNSPQGTPYQVPVGKTLTIARFLGEPQTAASVIARLDIGYGDDVVQNSVAAPTNPVVVYSVSWQANQVWPDNRDIYVPVPAGKYPWVRLTGGAYALTATGVIR